MSIRGSGAMIEISSAHVVPVNPPIFHIREEPDPVDTRLIYADQAKPMTIIAVPYDAVAVNQDEAGEVTIAASTQTYASQSNSPTIISQRYDSIITSSTDERGSVTITAATHTYSATAQQQTIVIV